MRTLITVCFLLALVNVAGAELECGCHLVQTEDGVEEILCVDCTVDPPVVTTDPEPVIGEAVKVTAEPEQGSGGGGCFITSSYK